MNKNIKPYKQRKDTCAIACMMMVLEYYNIIEKANWYDERMLYKKYSSRYMNGTPFSALAFHMSKNGLTITMYHENPNLFKNSKKIMDFELALEEYKKYLVFAERKGTKIINGININISLLKEKLKEDNLIILAGQISGCYHAILITDYDEETFEVCDPLYKEKQTRTYKEIEEFMNTDIGKWFITINN